MCVICHNFENAIKSVNNHHTHARAHKSIGSLTHRHGSQV